MIQKFESIFSGQSNMTGLGYSDELPATFSRPQASARMVGRTDWGTDSVRNYPSLDDSRTFFPNVTLQ